MNKELVSVIMPTYNYGNFLGQSITSVLNQTYDNLELIIVDNFSPDDTEEVVRSFKDNRIKYFKFSNNGVIAASRNKGIKESSGNFIAFLDSDDLWYKNKLDGVIKCFSQNPAHSLVCHDQYWVFREKQNQKTPVKYGPVSNYESFLFTGNCMATSAITVRKEALDACGSFCERKDFAGAEDYDLWLRLSRHNRFYFLRKILGEYTVHGSSLSSRIEIQAQVLLNVVENHYEDNFKNKGKYEITYRKRKADIWRQCARDLFRKREHAKAKEYLDRSLKLNLLSPKAFYLLFKILLNNASIV